MIRFELVTTIEDVQLSDRSWNKLVSENETNTIFQTHEWIKSWCKIFNSDNEFLFIQVFEDENLIGIAPMMISDDSFGTKTLRFISDNNADYCDFIFPQKKVDILNRLFRQVFVMRKDWHAIELKNIPSYSSTVDLATDIIAKTGLKSRINNSIACPTLLLKGDESDINNLLRKKTLKRRYNYFLRNGKVEFRNISTINEAKKHLDRFYEQHIKRLEFKKRKSLFLDERNRAFYNELVINLVPKGWLLFSVFEFNDRPLAYHFGFDYNAKVTWYKPCFDISFFKFSPGTVLLRYLVEYCKNLNKDEFDFTIGNEDFKSRFANKVRYNNQINIYRSSILFYYDRVISAIRKKIKRTIRFS